MSDEAIRALAILDVMLNLAMYRPSFSVQEAFTGHIGEHREMHWSSHHSGSILLRFTGAEVSSTVNDIYNELIVTPTPTPPSLIAVLPRPPREFFHQQLFNGNETTTIAMTMHLWLQHACTIYPQVTAFHARESISLKPGKILDAPIILRIINVMKEKASERYQAYTLYLLLPVAEGLLDITEKKTSLDLIHGLLVTNRYAVMNEEYNVEALEETKLLPPLKHLIASYSHVDTTTLLRRLADKLHTPEIQQHITWLTAKEARIKSLDKAKARNRFEEYAISC